MRGGFRGILNSAQTVGGYFATVRPLAQLVWRASPLLSIVSFGLMLLTGLVPAANIFIISALLDTLVRATQPASVGTDVLTSFVLLLALLAGLNVSGQVLEGCSNAVNGLQGTKISNHVEALIIEKAAEIDLANFEDSEFHNQMRTSANEAPYRPKQIIDDLTGSVATLTTLVSLGTVLFLWQPWIVPMILVASLAMLGVSLYFGSAFVDLINQRAETERKKFYLNTLLISEQAVKEIRLFGLKAFLLDRFRSSLETMYRQDLRLALKQVSYLVPAGIILTIVQSALIVFTALQALQGVISVGQFNLYAQSIFQVGLQLPGFLFTLGVLHQNNLFAAGLFRYLTTQPQVEAPRPQSKMRLEAISDTPHIEFQNVSFAYPGADHEVLDDVSFEVRPGETVALVGENGAGKSTLVKLLAGFFEPTRGRVLLDGVNINVFDREHLRAYLSVTFQDYTIYHLSVRENIGVGQVNQLDNFDRIRGAARRSGLDRIIEELPSGYATVLGRFWDRGHELSGGQRQLVALARALLRDAPILILDEPSAALDISAEQDFLQRLLEDSSIGRPRTVILISHRLTTVRHADRILVLKYGCLAEQGTHEQLMLKGGRYAEMFHQQATMYNRVRLECEAANETEPTRTRKGETDETSHHT